MVGPLIARQAVAQTTARLAGPGNFLSNADSRRYAVVGNRVFFVAGGVPYSTDGLPGHFSALLSNTTRVSSLWRAGDALYFAASDALAVPSIWVTNGEPDGTFRIQANASPDFLRGRPQPLGLDGRLFFPAQGTLFKVEPPVLSTQRVFGESDPVTQLSSFQPTRLTSFRGGLLLTGNDAANGYELWSSDGTTLGTRLVADINAGPTASSTPTAIADLGEIATFLADDGVHGRELWRTDGTPAGTSLIKDIVPGPIGAGDGSVTLLYSRLVGAVPGRFAVYVLFGQGGDYQIWSTDGTEAGTVRLADTSSASVAYVAGGAAAIGPHLYFFLSDADANASTTFRLYRTDGTVPGTIRLSGAFPGFSRSAYPPNFYSGVPALVPGRGCMFMVSGDDTPNGPPYLFRIRDADLSIRHVDSGTIELGAMLGHRLVYTKTTSTYGTEPWVLIFCPADFTADDRADWTDVLAYLELYFRKDVQADLNFSGEVDVADLFEYVQNWFAGCQ